MQSIPAGRCEGPPLVPPGKGGTGIGHWRTSWCMLASRRHPWWHRCGETFPDDRTGKIHSHLAWEFLDDTTSFLTGESERGGSCWFWVKPFENLPCLSGRERGTHTDTENQDARKLHPCQDILAFPDRKHSWRVHSVTAQWHLSTRRVWIRSPQLSSENANQDSSGLP